MFGKKFPDVLEPKVKSPKPNRKIDLVVDRKCTHVLFSFERTGSFEGDGSLKLVYATLVGLGL